MNVFHRSSYKYVWQSARYHIMLIIARFSQNLKITTNPNKTKKFNCAGCRHRNNEQSDIEMLELVGIIIDEIPTGPLSSHENCNIEPKLSENSLNSHRSPLHTLGVYQTMRRMH